MPRWPKLLSLAVHEFRTPITVVAGYIRMVLKERAGPISDQQRKLLEEAEKSCGRLSALVTEMSDCRARGGRPRSTGRRSTCPRLLREAIAALPACPTASCPVILDGAAARVSLDRRRRAAADGVHVPADRAPARGRDQRSAARPAGWSESRTAATVRARDRRSGADRRNPDRRADPRRSTRSTNGAADQA